MTLIEQAAQYIQQRNYMSAQQCYLQLLQTQPNNGQAMYGLGYIAQQQQDWPTVIEYLQQACQFLPQQPAPLLGLANAFNQVFSETDALTVLEYANQQCPNDESIGYALTQQYVIMGDIPAATPLLTGLLDSTNDELFAFACLDAAKIDIALLLQGHLERAQQFIKQQPSHSACIRLHYALGLMAKYRGQYTDAMTHWDSANALQFAECAFTVDDMAGLFDVLQTVDESVSSINAPTVPDDTSTPFPPLPFTPVFIVGLPRTGSSLLDKQLCDLSTSSQRIASVGEVDYIATQCARMIEQNTGYAYPTCLDHISDEQLQAARKRYVNAIGQHRIDADYIIDKLPANFQSLPLIYRLFPEAKVLHMTRDQAATALSIYSNDFGVAEPYFCNLAQMQQYFKHYTKVMCHFSDLYGTNLYTLRYENLVTDPQVQMKLVSDYLGIKPKTTDNLVNGAIVNSDDNGESAEKHNAQSQHVIKTLSAIQARQPIYQASAQIPDDLRPYFSKFK
ncbi:MAG: sulfotransferase [Glaciecola sp.]|jgi:tetratricopeptide (TPR) repeat protein|nr:sulfotransferase [Glaciecola sp.]